MYEMGVWGFEKVQANPFDPVIYKFRFRQKQKTRS